MRLICTFERTLLQRGSDSLCHGIHVNAETMNTFTRSLAACLGGTRIQMASSRTWGAMGQFSPLQQTQMLLRTLTSTTVHTARNSPRLVKNPAWMNTYHHSLITSVRAYSPIAFGCFQKTLSPIAAITRKPSLLATVGSSIHPQQVRGRKTLVRKNVQKRFRVNGKGVVKR